MHLIFAFADSITWPIGIMLLCNVRNRAIPLLYLQKELSTKLIESCNISLVKAITIES